MEETKPTNEAGHKARVYGRAVHSSSPPPRFILQLIEETEKFKRLLQ